jgi:hypothetical protein
MNDRPATRNAVSVPGILFLALTLSAGSANADDYTQYLKKGNQLYTDGKYVEAEESYIQAMNDKPDAAAAHFNIGNTFFAREDYTRAIEDFRSALVHARADRDLEIRARYNLATARVKESERSIGDVTDQEKLKTGVEFLQQAISDYRDVLEIDPDHEDARHNLAIAHLRIKNLFDTLKKLQEEAEKNKEKGQSPVEILKELIAEEEGEITLTRQALENATQESKLDEQKSRVNDAQTLAEKLTSGETGETSEKELEQQLEKRLAKLESDPEVELGAAEISSARKDISTGGKSFIASIGDAVNRLLDKVTALAADRRSAIEKDRADQEATRNKALGFVQALRDRAAGKAPPQPPAQQGQPQQPPPPPPEPLEPEVAKLFESIADLTSGAVDFMTTAVEKLTAAESAGEEAAATVLPLLEPTLTTQTSALEELKKALEEAEKLPKKEQQQQDQDGEKKDEEKDEEKDEKKDEEKDEKKDEEKDGEKKEQEGDQKDGDKDGEKQDEQQQDGEGEQQKKEEELSREQAEKLLRKFLERDARRAKDRKERDRQIRGPTGIGAPDRDW